MVLFLRGVVVNRCHLWVRNHNYFADVHCFRSVCLSVFTYLFILVLATNLETALGKYSTPELHSQPLSSIFSIQMVWQLTTILIPLGCVSGVKHSS